jgi:hypothetical protein
MTPQYRRRATRLIHTSQVPSVPSRARKTNPEHFVPGKDSERDALENGAKLSYILWDTALTE